MDERFNKAVFISCSAEDRDRLMRDLSEELGSRMRASGSFHQKAKDLVADLRALGHDLWSFDEDEDSETWMPDWKKPTGPGIIVTFMPESATVEWRQREQKTSQ